MLSWMTLEFRVTCVAKVETGHASIRVPANAYGIEPLGYV